MNEIPESVLEYGIDYDWNEEDIWEINCPIENIPIDKLSWHFDIPFWDTEENFYGLTPNEVIANPKNYPDHYERIMNSDTNYPIDVLENKGRLVILDGLHRLAKFKLLNIETIPVRIIPKKEFLKVAREENIQKER